MGGREGREEKVKEGEGGGGGGGAVTQKYPILNATQVPQFRNRHWFRAMGAYSKF